MRLRTHNSIIEQSQDPKLLAQALNNNSQCYRMMRLHDKEIECLRKALQYES